MINSACMDPYYQRCERYNHHMTTDWHAKIDAYSGTAFQKQVWHALCDIPRGTTLTYSELATKIGKPRAVRAVANAVGRNPFAPHVPCHRIWISELLRRCIRQQLSLLASVALRCYRRNSRRMHSQQDIQDRRSIRSTVFTHITMITVHVMT